MTNTTPGAHFERPSTCRFHLWAPRGKRVLLRLVGPVYRDITLSPGTHGHFEAAVDGVAPGQRYFYRLDDGPDRPDPASRWQPDGVHGPSAVVDRAFAWSDAGWRGVALSELVLYELHVGTFTPEGTFDGAIGQLDRLRHLGVNALSLMPVAQFPGSRNWGYDGVYPFAVQTTYGGVAGLKRLVDAAHARGLSVILDVVYNHLGPEGNYFRDFGQYFTDQYKTPWGEPLNFDGPGSDAVRDYFLANARMWQEEFHLDGLRLDAVPWIKDFSASHVLADLADRARELSPKLGRRFHVIGESDINDPRVIRPRERGGLGLDAQWSDDFHHAIHAYFTGERGGYYADHGTLAEVAKAYRENFVLTGEHSRFRQRRYGANADDRPGEQFVIFAQNHDQIGNRPRGDRLSALVDRDTLKLVAGLLLTSPYLPMLFMGEEYGETAPFPFFVSHGDGGLVDRVRRGRKVGFLAFGMTEEAFDPGAEETFRRAKLDVSKADGDGRELCEWHRELLRLRRELPALGSLDRQRMKVMRNEADLLVVLRWCGRDKVLMVMNFTKQPATATLPVPEGEWTKLLDSTASGDVPSQLRGPSEVVLPLAALAFVLYHAE